MLGRIRLQWWRESIAAIYDGRPVRRHEVVEPLAETIRARGLTRAHFERLIDAREADLGDTPPPDLAALEAYAEASSAPLVLLALEALGRARRRGACGRTRGSASPTRSPACCAPTPFHARARRTYLPADLLAAHGIEPHRTLYELKPAPGARRRLRGRCRARARPSRCGARAAARRAARGDAGAAAGGAGGAQPRAACACRP